MDKQKSAAPWAKPKSAAPWELPWDKPQPEEQDSFVGAAMQDGFPVVEGAQTAISNIPSSLGGYVKGMAQSALHPMETAKALGSTIAGGVEKLAGRQGPNVDQFDAMVAPYTDKDEFWRTVQEDPVRILGDASGLLMGVGGATRAAGARGAGASMVRAGAAIEPLTAAFHALAPIAKAIPGSIAPRLYQSAAKMSTTMTPAEQRRVAQLALDNKVVLNLKGFNKLLGEIDTLKGVVDDFVNTFEKTGPNRTATIDQLFGQMNELRDRAKLTGESRKVEAYMRTMMKENSTAFPLPDGSTVRVLNDLSATQINTMKRQLYKQLEGQYGATKFSPFQAQARKRIAHNAMKMLESWIPEIAGPNASMKDRLDIKKAIERGANRIANRDLIGLGVPVKTGVGVGAGAATGMNPYGAAIVGLALGILDSPAPKTRIAIAINRLKKEGAQIKPTSAAIRLGLYQGSRAVEEAKSIGPQRVTHLGHTTDEDVQRLLRGD